jgi:hypothetical protein
MDFNKLCNADYINNLSEIEYKPATCTTFEIATYSVIALPLNVYRRDTTEQG